MATIKSYTDIDQSKKLAEILPIESADMYWKNGVSDKYIQCFTPFVSDDYKTNVDYDYDVPCWSLASLLGVLRGTNISTPDTLNKSRYSCWNDYDIVYASNPIDVCYEMILKLHEKGLL